MNRARNLKRISWTSGSNTSQVKSFLSEDCPSIVGHKFKDHLQSKTVSIGPSITSKHDDLPPGFEDNHFRSQSKAELSHIIPQINWECPSKITLNYGWHIAGGEDSKEKYNQKFREMRVSEAIYPRISVIPYSPSVSFAVENQQYDDSLTPLIPLIPVEEEVEDTEPESRIEKFQSPNTKQKYIPPTTSALNPQCNNINSHCSGKPPGATSSEADIAATASAAAIAAIIKTNEQGSVIDMDMLLKLFTDPTMIEKLIEDATIVSAPSNISSIPTSNSLSSSTPAIVAFETTPTNTKRQATLEKPSISKLTSTFDKKVITATTSVHLPKPVSPKKDTVTQSSASAKKVQSTTTGVVKDVDYYNNPVKQHDNHKEDKKSNKNLQGLKRSSSSNTKSHGRVEFKSRKTCVYFGSSRGCRNGSNCAFKHDLSNKREACNTLMHQNAKRWKEGPSKERIYT